MADYGWKNVGYGYRESPKKTPVLAPVATQQSQIVEQPVPDVSEQSYTPQYYEDQPVQSEPVYEDVYTIDNRKYRKEGKAYRDYYTGEIVYVDTSRGVFLKSDLDKGIYFGETPVVVEQTEQQSNTIPNPARFYKDLTRSDFVNTTKVVPIEEATPARFYKQSSVYTIPELPVDRRIMGFIPNPIESHSKAVSEFITKSMGIKNYGQVKYIMETAVVPAVERSAPIQLGMYGVGYGYVSRVIEDPLSEGLLTIGTIGIGKFIELGGIGISAAVRRGIIGASTGVKISSAAKYSNIALTAGTGAISGYAVVTSPTPSITAGRITADFSAIAFGGYISAKTPTVYDAYSAAQKARPTGYLSERGELFPQKLALESKQLVKNPTEELHLKYKDVVEAQSKNVNVYTQTKGSVYDFIELESEVKTIDVTKAMVTQAMPKVTPNMVASDIISNRITPEEYLYAKDRGVNIKEMSKMLSNFGVKQNTRTDFIAEVGALPDLTVEPFSPRLKSPLGETLQMFETQVTQKPVFDIKSAISSDVLLANQKPSIKSFRIKYQETMIKQTPKMRSAQIQVVSQKQFNKQSYGLKTFPVERTREIQKVFGISMSQAAIKQAQIVIPEQTELLTPLTTQMGSSRLFYGVPKLSIPTMPRFDIPKSISPPLAAIAFPMMGGYMKQSRRRKSSFFWFNEQTPVWNPKQVAVGNLFSTGKKQTRRKKK